MSSHMKVLVCSASPDRVNHNAVLRTYVANGFAEVLSEQQVMACSLDYAAQAASHFQPDLLLVFGSCMPDSCNYTELRTYCARSGATLAFWLHDDPYEFDLNVKIYAYADLIFSNDQWATQHINHPRVYHLPLAADRQAHFRPVRTVLDRDVFFCGVGFPNRRQLLADSAAVLAQYDVAVLGAEWDEALPFCHNQRCANADLPDMYASSLVTLNLGRRYNLANRRYQLDATTPGPRTFEAAMAGAVQCAYVEGLELADYFHFDQEILVFDTPAELVASIAALREDPQRRQQIAEQTQARAMRDHTYAARARFILSTLVNANGTP